MAERSILGPYLDGYPVEKLFIEALPTKAAATPIVELLSPIDQRPIELIQGLGQGEGRTGGGGFVVGEQHRSLKHAFEGVERDGAPKSIYQ
jgi:hypothetical protein